MILFLMMMSLLYISLSLLIASMPHLFLSRRKRIEHLIRGKTLLIIAHPDDECMFFGPTIFLLIRSNIPLYVLCLSDGDFNGQDGDRRHSELLHALNVMGVSSDNVLLAKSDDLKDGDEWCSATVRDAVLNHTEKLSIKNIITFDDYGVSGHPNHISIFRAVKDLQNVTLFSLDSVSILRKYANFMDVPIALFTQICCQRKAIAIVDWKQRKLIQQALYRHISQMVWFRRLYSRFSSYLFVNILTRV